MCDLNILLEDIKKIQIDIEYVMIYVKIKLFDGKGKIRCWLMKFV